MKTTFESAKDDPKRFWRNIYDIFPKNEDNKSTIHLRKLDETATFINNFVTNIEPILA